MDPELKALLDDLAANDTKLQAAVEKYSAELAANGQASDEIKNELQALSAAGVKNQARILGMEQKFADAMANRAGETVVQHLSAGVMESEAIKSVINGSAGSGRFTTEGTWFGGGIYGATTIGSGTAGAGNAGVMVRPDRQAMWITPEDRPFTIRDILTVGRTDSNAIEYVKETSFTNAARFVTEGQVKPQSDMQFELVTAPVRTLAHWVKATRQILADIPMLRTYIDGRLRYGLKFVEENAILNGNGTGQNILGLKPSATDYDTSRTATGDTKIDTIRRAMTQVRLSEYTSDAIILHPNDWEDIELTKTTDGAYIWANPAGLRGPTLWGRRVVETVAQTAGQFTVGAFRTAELFDREEMTVEIATQHASDFTSNLVTILGEERVALAVPKPLAIVDGTFPQT